METIKDILNARLCCSSAEQLPHLLLLRPSQLSVKFRISLKKVLDVRRVDVIACARRQALRWGLLAHPAGASGLSENTRSQPRESGSSSFKGPPPRRRLEKRFAKKPCRGRNLYSNGITALFLSFFFCRSAGIN